MFTGLCEYIVSCVSPDHHASRRRIHAIGRMTWDVSGSDCTDLDITQRPDSLRLVFCLEGNHVCQLNWPARKAYRASPFDPPSGKCSAHGTKVQFYDTPKEAAAHAKADQKLVLVLHVSGLFEDPDVDRLIGIISSINSNAGIDSRSFAFA